MFSLATPHPSWGGVVAGGIFIKPPPVQGPVTSLSYRDTKPIYTIGQAIDPNMPIIGGGPATAFTINPMLPAGLGFDKSTGKILGTPTVASVTTHTVTAFVFTNGTKTSEVGVKLLITIKVAPPVFSYSNPAPYYVGTQITTLSPASTGGAIASYTISPELSATGLRFNTTLGQITGTPTAAKSLTTYTVTGTNASGSLSKTVAIEVKTALPAFTYPGAMSNGSYYEQRIVQGGTLSLTPVSTGGTITLYTVTPALPDEAKLDPVTGRIYGKLNTVKSSTPYKFTAINSSGSFSQTLLIGCKPGIPVFSYPLATVATPAVATAGVTNLNLTPTSTGGTIASYALASGALPSGLSLNPVTGVISGIPVTGNSSISTFTIKGTNETSFALATVTLQIKPKAPSGLRYSIPAPVYSNSSLTNVATVAFGDAPYTFSVSPELPNGLLLNASSGAITGVPADPGPSTNSYTVTASNVSGSTTKVISIQIKKTPFFDYGPTSTFSFTKGTAISSLTPVSRGGPITRYSFSGNLPGGLKYDADKGVISGTPDGVDVSKETVIQGVNSAGSYTVKIKIEIKMALPVFSYPALGPLDAGVKITDVPPNGLTQLIDSYKVIDVLPDGLDLNTTTGVISGTPTTPQAGAKNYKIQATNKGGSSEAIVSIEIQPGRPLGLTYLSRDSIYVEGTAITANLPSLKSGTGPFTYKVEEDDSTPYPDVLPEGLILNKVTGVITGTPTKVTPYQYNINISVTNASGSTYTTLFFNVKAAPPVFSYTSLNPYFLKTPITPISPVSTGGKIISYSISPALSSELSFDTVTGSISGTPTGEPSVTTYTITGTNITGSTTTIVSLRIQEPLPIFSYEAHDAYTAGISKVSLSPLSTGGAITSFENKGPALPSGLSLNPTTGVISGTPKSGDSLVKSYTITASNITGSATATVLFQIHPRAPTGLSYVSGPWVFYTGLIIYPVWPNLTDGEGPYKYTVMPDLPKGLVLNADTGVIFGTLTDPVAKKQYVVTVTNVSGTTQTTLTIEVGGAPSFTYDQYPPGGSYFVGFPIAKRVPKNVVAVSTFSALGLPPGLSIDPLTGEISGTPTATTGFHIDAPGNNFTVAGANQYTITYQSRLNFYVTTKTPTIVITSPVSIIQKYIEPATINIQTQVTTPGTTVGFINLFEGNDCQGNPIATIRSGTAGTYTYNWTGVAGGTHTIRASVTNFFEKTSCSEPVTFYVTPTHPAFTYPGALGPFPATYPATSTAVNLAAVSTGGTIERYSVSPALPAGLKLNEATGAITGTPTTPQSAKQYIVTATNSVGSVDVTLLIQIPATAVVGQTTSTDQDAQALAISSGGYNILTNLEAPVRTFLGMFTDFLKVSSSTPEPVVVTGPEVDLYSAVQGESTYGKLFEIKNNSTKTILLDAPIVDPGILVAVDISSKSLAPGATATFTLALKSDTPGIIRGKVKVPVLTGGLSSRSFYVGGVIWNEDGSIPAPAKILAQTDNVWAGPPPFYDSPESEEFAIIGASDIAQYNEVRSHITLMREELALVALAASETGGHASVLDQLAELAIASNRSFMTSGGRAKMQLLVTSLQSLPVDLFLGSVERGLQALIADHNGQAHAMLMNAASILTVHHEHKLPLRAFIEVLLVQTAAGQIKELNALGRFRLKNSLYQSYLKTLPPYSESLPFTTRLINSIPDPVAQAPITNMFHAQYPEILLNQAAATESDGAQ